jgi:hypothetical protein
MFSNNGSGWHPCKPFESEKKDTQVPYGIEGLSHLTKRERKYLRMNKTPGQDIHTAIHTTNPNNVKRKFGW